MDPIKSRAGRPPGALNKTTRSVKAALEEAFDTSGGIDALVAWARENPGDFYRLWARLLPVGVAVSDTSGLAERLMRDRIAALPED